MNLYLEKKALKIKIPLKIQKQDSKKLLDPLFNRDNIGDKPIMSVEVDREDDLDINHRVRHIIKMMQDWIKKPFELDPIPQIVIFHAQACLANGRGKKVTIATFVVQLLVRPKTMHQLNRPMGYYQAQKSGG